MKNSRWFPHDYHARHDPKLENLRLEMGCEGIGIYWCMIEMLYEEGGSLRIDKIGLYAKALNTTEKKLNHTLDAFELFKKNSSHFYSLSLSKRLKDIKNRSEKAKEKAIKRWDAVALQRQCRGNAKTGHDSKDVNVPKDVDVDSKPLCTKTVSVKDLTPSNVKDVLDFFSKCPDSLKVAWQDYLDMRKKIRKPMTKRAEELAIKELEKLGNTTDDQIEILNQSVKNSWTGLFPIKQGGYDAGRSKSDSGESDRSGKYAGIEKEVRV